MTEHRSRWERGNISRLQRKLTKCVKLPCICWCCGGFCAICANFLTMAMVHSLRQGPSEMYLDRRTVLDKYQRYCTCQVLLKIHNKVVLAKVITHSIRLKQGFSWKNVVICMTISSLLPLPSAWQHRGNKRSFGSWQFTSTTCMCDQKQKRRRKERQYY